MARFERILVFVPNWVGDVVMATPTLLAIRRAFPDARIVHVLRAYVAEVLEGLNAADANIAWPVNSGGWIRRWADLRVMVRRLREERFDAAVLLTNSFKSALVARLARAERRFGYARDGRGWLLTDRLEPKRAGRRFIPDPALDYYNRLVEAMGCPPPGTVMRLATTARDEAVIDERLAAGGATRSAGESHSESSGFRHHAAGEGAGRYAETTDQNTSTTSVVGSEGTAGEGAGRYVRGGRAESAADERPLVVLNPGASFGPAKCWPAEKYAAVADALTERLNARVVASLGPKEGDIAERIRRAARRPLEVFHDPPLGLGPLKALIRRADLLVTNDTGPRHFAPAFGVPVVTIFGSSDPAWTEIYYADERRVMLSLDCQPCMERTCPLGHHKCMNELGVEPVLAAAEELLRMRGRGGATVKRPAGAPAATGVTLKG